LIECGQERNGLQRKEGTSPDVPKIFGNAWAVPSRKRHSLFTTRQLPFAIRFLPDLPICRPADLPIDSVAVL
jgi:hypothetical protein